MILNLMEGDTIATNTFISSIKSFNSDGRQRGTIKTLLKNFILPEPDMAIKENQSNSNKYVYAIPVKPPLPTMTERMKSIHDAKQAFLNSTVTSKPLPINRDSKKEEHTIHYAELAVTKESDSRSTGGGKYIKPPPEFVKSKEYCTHVELLPNFKKKMDQNQRKVSFKIKNASASYRRPPLAKTVMVTSNKVSELTQKFNSLQSESHTGSPRKAKLVKTLGDLQTVSKCSISNSSTPSSTLSSSPNIKIVLRPRRGSKKRNNRKRCSSMDSIENYHATDSSTKIHIIRSKSDGTRIPKTSKKRLKYQDSGEQPCGSDSVDGSPVKVKETEAKDEKIQVESIVVKNVVKKFECEIIAQTNSSNTLKRQPDKSKSTIPLKDKPKVPEKKSSLVLTKNVVVKDGIPKFKTIKPIGNEIIRQDNVKEQTIEVPRRKELLYDRKKFRTNYIHTEKLPLKVVEIIPEDISENAIVTINGVDEVLKIPVISIAESKENENSSQDINPPITPNESFLWRRKSSSQIYSDSEKTLSESSYSIVSVTLNGSTVTCSDEPQDISVKEESPAEVKESQVTVVTSEQSSEPNMDFESNLVEAYNKEIMVGFTSKPKKEEVEDYYEPLEPRDIDNVVIIPIKSIDKSSKINCPLPEIPKDSSIEAEDERTPEEENIYQCLLEMRSHPEGDESSFHNYELCETQFEERTRGDGDSDDGYEYCKSPIKPYCLTSSSGIQIAENYQPNAKDNIKNYAISKSVSGTSTVSYEKIGSERIYEKIPARPPKSKNSSPTYSSRHSFISDYTGYNDNENIYDTIKHSDGTSLSHCYESIPNSPSMVKLRNNLKKQLASNAQKRLSFDTVSNISQSTMSSEQKTNSIYGQRSVISYNGQEIAFQVPGSETSVSDRSDRSDDWVDVSDEEKNEQKIIIVRERSRGRKSPISWSQKVRHQWQKSPKQKSDDKDCDSSDSGHLYESLDPPAHPTPAPPIEEDFDSFDSDTDSDDHEKSTYAPASAPALPASRLPSPPASGTYTLTKIASAAQKKMRQIKRNLTKRYSVAMDGIPFKSSNQIYETKPKKSPIYANCEKQDHAYSNINFETKPVLNKIETPLTKVYGTLKGELKSVMGDKRASNGDIPPALPDKPPPEKPVTPTIIPTSDGKKDTGMLPASDVKKDSGTLSRKAYFSFKSRFRRASSLAVDIDTEVPSALKITNSTFYLTDSMDGDSGFSNCSDSGQAGGETLSPESGLRRRDGRRRLADSSPCLCPRARPALPPPPPPPPPPPALPAPHATDFSAVNEELKRLLPTLSRKEKGPRTRSSWYAECGADTSSASTASWYAEAGLYQAGNVSTSSGASSGSHPASPLPHSLFTHEPLYQFYNAAKVESVCRETGDSDSDAYEPGSQRRAGSPAGPQVPPPSGPQAPPARPSAMALVAPRGPSRTLWCEVPEVLNSAVLSSLAPAQKRLQEAKFELLTSEASYLNSLNVLEANFIAHPAFREAHVLPKEDWETLFATILPVRKCSQLLMNELERCWQENILLQGICEIVRSHAEEHFQVYVKYCENQALMVKALQRLHTRPAFANALKKLESHPSCQSLSLHSFLMLPMQRVTRLPLLMDAVLKHLEPEDGEHRACVRALLTLNHFVSQCNEGARNTERIEEMYRLARVIEFPPSVRDPPSLGPACGRRDRRPVRWLVRSGEMTQLVWKSEELKLTFGKKFHKLPLHLFLFNDLLVLTKKKSEDCYVAVDHCARSLLEVCSSEGPAGTAAAKHALLITLLENHEGRTLEMLMSCASETEWSRWAEALAPPAAGAEGEAVYAGWDCPQVCALYAYAPAQPDELPLAEGDVVNVSRKSCEGWYYGERTRDGEAGWFPGAYTAEIASAHVRARNLRQRYRLLALSGTYRGHKRAV